MKYGCWCQLGWACSAWSYFIRSAKSQVWTQQLIRIRGHLHQCRADPPAGAGAFSMRVECLHWRRSVRSFNLRRPHFAELGHWSINTDQSVLPIPAGPAEESFHEWSLRAPRRPAAGQRARRDVNTTTQFLQIDPLRSLRAGSARGLRMFPAVV